MHIEKADTLITSFYITFFSKHDFRINSECIDFLVSLMVSC